VRSKVEAALTNVEFVAATTDGWSSKSGLGYITVTSHWLTEKFEMKHATLDTIELHSHTHEQLRDAVGNVLVDWNIAEDRLSVVVVDGVATNGAMLRLGQWDGWVCFAHTLQLAILEGINEAGIKPFIDAVRHCVTYFKRSVIATHDLLHTQSVRDVKIPLRLMQDCET